MEPPCEVAHVEQLLIALWTHVCRGLLKGRSVTSALCLLPLGCTKSSLSVDEAPSQTSHSRCQHHELHHGSSRIKVINCLHPSLHGWAYAPVWRRGRCTRESEAIKEMSCGVS